MLKGHWIGIKRTGKGHAQGEDAGGEVGNGDGGPRLLGEEAAKEEVAVQPKVARLVLKMAKKDVQIEHKKSI